MHKDKVQYTKHHLLRNIIRQQAAKAKVRRIACFAVCGNASGAISFSVAKQLRKTVQATVYMLCCACIGLSVPHLLPFLVTFLSS